MPLPIIDPELLRGVELLSLDAGNTIIFLDHARLASLVTRAGFPVDAATLIRCEGDAKLAQEHKTLFDFEWSYRDQPGGVGWGGMVGTMIHLGGVPLADLPNLVGKLWREHVELNLWSVVPAGLADALDRLRARGVRVAVVSNSEGMLDVLFAQLGLVGHYDVLIDSGVVGIEKPDARIFEMALTACAASAETTLHLGDSIATDIVGARGMGMRCALIDPFGHVDGRHMDVPRVPGAVEVANAL